MSINSDIVFGIGGSLLGSIITMLIVLFISRDKKIIEKIDSATDSIKGDIQNFKNMMKDVFKKIAKEDTLNFSDIDIPTGLTASDSPIQLTEKGEKLFKKSNMKNIIDKNKDSLFDSLSKSLNGSKNKFDIQTASVTVMQQFVSKNEEIKSFAYEVGKLNLLAFVEIGYIYLRDLYIKEKIN